MLKPLHTTVQLLDALAEKNGKDGWRATDYRLSKLLQVATSNVSAYRKARAIPAAEIAARMAVLLEWDAAYVIACVEHERLERAKVADPLEDTSEMLSTWERIAEKFRPVVPGIVLAMLGVAMGGLVPTPSEAYVRECDGLHIDQSIHYAHLDEVENRRRRRKKKPRPSPPPPAKGSFWQTVFPAMRSPLQPV